MSSHSVKGPWEPPCPGMGSTPPAPDFSSQSFCCFPLTKCLGGSNPINTQISARAYSHDFNRATQKCHTPGSFFFHLFINQFGFHLPFQSATEWAAQSLILCSHQEFFYLFGFNFYFLGYYYLQLEQLSVLTVFVTRVSCKNFNAHLKLISSSLAAKYLIISGKEKKRAHQ